jgi:hypothetical protein
VTDVSSDVVGSVSGERMGEGPGKGGGTDLTEVTDDSEDTTEGPATDSGSGMRAGQQPQSLPRRQTAFSGLRRHSASSYSVDASVGHTSAVTNSDVSSLSQTGAVIYSDIDSTLGLDLDSTETVFVASDSEEHTKAVS